MKVNKKALNGDFYPTPPQAGSSVVQGTVWNLVSGCPCDQTLSRPLCFLSFIIPFPPRQSLWKLGSICRVVPACCTTCSGPGDNWE